MAMLRPASEMKDSGVNWLGLIPQNWNTIRFKFVHIGANVGMSIDRDYWSNDENDTAFYTAQIKPIHMRYDGFPEWKYTSENDLLLARNATPYVYLPVLKAAYTDHIIRVDIKPLFDRRYIRYCLQQSIAYDVADGVSLPTWSVSIWNRQVIPFLSIKEQQAIADYLDDRCSTIDEIITEATASIEEYKELKQAVIFEAVTKGLDKNIPMKDSGVEWIGDVPSHWTVKKFKYVASVDANLVAPDEYMDYQQIAPDCIEKDSGRLIKERTVSEAGVESWNQLFHKGQLIYSKIRPILNKVIIAPYDGLCSADMYPLDVVEDIEFVQKAMLSKYFVDQVGLITQDRVKMPKINKDELANIYMAIPPHDEQIEIVKYLDNRMMEIDGVIDEKQSLIDDLQAYKKSLIYEVVTGKRRVV